MFKEKSPLPFLYWIITGIFVFLFIYLLVKLFPIYGAVFSFLWHLLAPFIISCFIAYLLYPVVKKIHTYRVPKGIAILLIYLLFFGGAGYLIYRVYPAVIHQLNDLTEQLPELTNMYQDLIYRLYEYTSFLPEVVHDKMDQLIAGIEASMENLLGRLVAGFTKIFDMIIFLTVIPVLVFYFLKDFTKIKAYVKRWVPVKYHKDTSVVCHAIDKSLGNYIRGQLIVCLFVSLATFVIFQLLHIKYALLLAIIMGLTNIIPYFGPIIGAIPAVAITFTMSAKLIIFVLLAIFVIQLIESNLLSPYIVGKSIAIHPIAIIFALLLGGELGGVIGMIVAVPSLTILKVIVTHIIRVKAHR
ncbi:AI-2E family transporter [Virgibacillus dakarensis]|uniref:AI-2E family transporter n=1 Tax=Lentibacillus populi TaxID=1827502 RepID=A0A9W5TTU7_9BACI|nr:AI-2E family transporter [Lentibacillus populi]MBT2215107.1 AI-2E family transporter [Virgibacillus dakarensis]MTW84160.1 AI-2E family transporter [Virgibacillus dakarensis]GGB28688.1 AI-2E family transporter [Lentibacillus populi]